MKTNSDAGVKAGLLSLLADAHKMPRPFDVLIIDDTSRLGRMHIDVACPEESSLAPEKAPNMEGSQEEK